MQENGSKQMLSTGAVACRHSCFGASSLPSGYTNFRCGTRQTFIDCRAEFVNGQMPFDNAGVICSRLTSIEGNYYVARLLDRQIETKT